MARLGDIVKISSSSKQLDGDKFWLLNLDMVEQQTGAIVDYNYVSGKDLNGSIKILSDLIGLIKAMADNLHIDYRFSNDDLFTRPLTLSTPS